MLDIADVSMTNFNPDPVVEGYNTSCACELTDGFPEEVTEDTVWKIGDGDVDIGMPLYIYLNIGMPYLQTQHIITAS